MEIRTRQAITRIRSMGIHIHQIRIRIRSMEIHTRQIRIRIHSISGRQTIVRKNQGMVLQLHP